MKNYILYVPIAITVILFEACTSKNTTNNTSEVNNTTTNTIDIRALEKLQPKDAVLAEKYKRSCFICHANPDAKAHLVGDKEDWSKLINEKGMPLLITHVNEGFNTMPPKGQCADCTDSEYEALIKFMAGIE